MEAGPAIDPQQSPQDSWFVSHNTWTLSLLSTNTWYMVLSQHELNKKRMETVQIKGGNEIKVPFFLSIHFRIYLTVMDYWISLRTASSIMFYLVGLRGETSHVNFSPHLRLFNFLFIFEPTLRLLSFMSMFECQYYISSV